MLLFLADGSSFAVTEREMIAFGLYTGIELEEETLADLKAAGRAGLTLQRAAAMLGRRALSRRDLVQKLTEKGSLPEDAMRAADRMEELGVLDDEAYAAAVVRQYSARGWGEKKLRDELFRRASTARAGKRRLRRLRLRMKTSTACCPGGCAGSNPTGRTISARPTRCTAGAIPGRTSRRASAATRKTGAKYKNQAFLEESFWQIIPWPLFRWAAQRTL